MEEKVITIGKNPLIGLTKLVQGERVSAVNVHDCVDTITRAVRDRLRTVGNADREGESLYEALRAVRGMLSDILTERWSALWSPESENHVPKGDYDYITMADLSPHDVTDLVSRAVAWLESTDNQ